METKQELPSFADLFDNLRKASTDIASSVASSVKSGVIEFARKQPLSALESLSTVCDKQITEAMSKSDNASYTFLSQVKFHLAESYRYWKAYVDEQERRDQAAKDAQNPKAG